MVCQLYYFGYFEDSDHLFVSCTFAQHVWQWLACCFGTSLPSNGSIGNFLNAITRKPCSPQLKIFSIGGCLYVLMDIRKTCNRLRIDDKAPSLMRVFPSTKAWLRFAAPHMPGHSSGILDNNLLIGLGIQPTPRSHTASRLVPWHPPISPWVKLNIDGLAKGNPGPVACGGVFRDRNGHYIGGFGRGLGNQTAFFAELMGVILGIDYAFKFSWRYIWLESDSTSVLACMTSSSFSPPWPLRIAWLNCLSYIRSMSFYCSHILREGNTIADRLANLGLASS
ncbi:putative ribonuclease H-like domain-containing protein [Rosa chinensis]|uniref:Putative ribonuclease H-like domain-containing protein n=1 Tax=Rosa chinensis TaxID=74649 RepID=A0A2P6RBQ0_ROSCH|nr:putative ribonuclease H-like domain-containing protein [Rosa chinensis]